MIKTTIYLPEELDTELGAEAASTGLSKAELIRRGIAMVLSTSSRPRSPQPLPVFDSRRPLTVGEMDDAIHQRIQERNARR